MQVDGGYVSSALIRSYGQQNRQTQEQITNKNVKGTIKIHVQEKNTKNSFLNWNNKQNKNLSNLTATLYQVTNLKSAVPGLEDNGGGALKVIIR